MERCVRAECAIIGISKVVGLCAELMPELLNEAEVAKWSEVNGPTLLCGAEVAELKE